ncbi:MAG TPA: peroxiredoxin [Thermoanaerobaculia bacterium]|nr:peroxiredoxin [Thermoanaerobaculia bacterium]
MPIEVGQRIPEVTLMTLERGEIRQISTGELCAGRTIVLFAVPGAFTPTCSEQHLPGFVEHAEEIRRKGVAAICCVAVNDHYVMDAWGASRGVGHEIAMLADGNGDFARAMGLETDSRRFGLGFRSRRYAAIFDDGVLRTLLLDEPGRFEKSSAEEILTAL